MIERAKVVLGELNTYLVAAVAVLTVLAGELDKIAGVPSVVVKTIATAISVLGGAVLIIRRVTPVAKEQQGLIAKENQPNG
jgi:hypothetical protein